MSKRPHVIALGLLLLVVVVVLNLPDRQASRLRRAWGSAFVPVFGLAGSAQGLLHRSAQAAIPRRTLLREIESLRQTNEALRCELQELTVTREENQRLRQAVAWQPRAPWQLRLARVIAHDPAQWWRSLQIDLGSRHGIRTNQPVLTATGLVGRISEVAYTRSQVILVGDPNCRFSGQVNGTADKGIVAPNDSSFDRQLVDFIYVPPSVTLKPGSLVITSGEGGIFPRGIPVGQIVDVRTNQFGLYLEARLRLCENLNRLQEVWVLFP